MAPSDIVNAVIGYAQSDFQYMLPIIGVLGAVMFIASFVTYLVTRIAERTFK